MFDIGFSEILMFGMIALIVLGPEKLPQAAREAGRWYAKIRFTIANMQNEIETELNIAETRRLMQEEIDKIKQAEAQMQQELAEIRGSVQSIKNPSLNKNIQQSDDKKTDLKTRTNINKPLENKWFIIGAYDKNRRLPSAPFLPNYQADPLLNRQPLNEEHQDEPKELNQTPTQKTSAVNGNVSSDNNSDAKSNISIGVKEEERHER